MTLIIIIAVAVITASLMFLNIGNGPAFKIKNLKFIIHLQKAIAEYPTTREWSPVTSPELR